MDGSLSFITALIGLILSMGVFGFLYRRKQKHSNIINLVAYQSLGAKKGVAALQVGNEILVLGIMPNGLRVLKTLEAKEVLEPREEPYSERIQKLRRLKEAVDE
ncbi:MAG: flagellar biosynthetic protein FliO [Deltaproteobacteria bacterium]|nr:flagellar biosynthetic protein FliO [Deltaproteobacteria bacterium]